jgi:integrase
VHRDRSAAWRNSKHAAQWLSTLSQYAFPVFGSRRVDHIDTPDVLRVLSPIWLTKPETARRVRQRIGTVLDWSKAAGFRSGDNPVEGVSLGLPKQPDRAGHHAALAYQEVPAFIARLQDSSISEPGKLAFEFLILTATRTNEVLGLDGRRSISTAPPGRSLLSGPRFRGRTGCRCLRGPYRS